ncbi:MAG: hypothetical protein ACFB2X_08535 [Rivularia sp. (in: cyanobacteria)]
MKEIKLKLSILASLLVLLLMPNVTNAEENNLGESIYPQSLDKNLECAFSDWGC